MAAAAADASPPVPPGRSGLRRRRKAVQRGCAATATVQERAEAGRAALELLAHSVRAGHDRLALIRLGLAVRCGVAIPAPLWRYCEEVARSLDPCVLDRLMQPLLQAASAAPTAAK